MLGMIIDTKTKMYKLLRAGKLGNIFRVFSSVEEVKKSGLKKVAVRYADRSATGKYFFEVTSVENIDKTVESLVRRGANREYLLFNEGDFGIMDKMTIQGEVGEVGGNFELAYSQIPGITNREARIRGYIRAVGLKARLMLKYYMWWDDYEWILNLLDKYPEHIIEFTTYSVPVGGIPNRNTVIWEVRHY